MKCLSLHIVLMVLCVACVTQVDAQIPSGSLTGKAVDAETGEPLIGANVVLRGTVLGRVTNTDGTFSFTNLPVGRYTVAISMVGYETHVASDVAVSLDASGHVEVRLKSIVIQTDPVVVTASRREQSLQEVPVSVATVTAQAIAERNNVTLDEALRYVPGVNVLQDQINIRGSSGYSRSVGSRVLILFDGLPFLTGDTGEISWETIPIHHIQRVEIVKGAGSALYGSSALGGVINIITKDIGDQPQLRVRLFSSVYDQPRYEEWRWYSGLRFNSGALVDYAGRFDALQYQLSLSRTMDESYRVNDTYHRWSFFTKLKYDLTPYQSVTVLGNFLARRHDNFIWWKSLDEATRPADSQLNTSVPTQRGNINLAYKEFTSDKFFYTIKGMYFGNYWEQDSLDKTNIHARSDLFQAEFQGNYEASDEHILTFGLMGSYTQVASNIFSSPLGAGAAIYVQDEYAPAEGWNATVGVRFDYQRVSARGSKGLLNPKIGLAYHPNAETKLRAAYGSGFRFPSIGEWYTQYGGSGSIPLTVVVNTNLQVERSNTFEVGASKVWGDFVSAELSLFRNDFENLIEPGVVIKDGDPVIQFENVTKARIQGGELGVNLQLIRKILSTDFGYTYTYPEDVSTGAILKFRPRHLFFGATSFTYDDFRASADYRYMSRIERIDDNLVQLAPIIHGDQRTEIHIVDVRASYDLLSLGLPVRVGFNINNLFNYHYVELIGNLAPVRTFALIVEGVL